jgi:hypothetical protein
MDCGWKHAVEREEQRSWLIIRDYAARYGQHVRPYWQQALIALWEGLRHRYPLCCVWQYSWQILHRQMPALRWYAEEGRVMREWDDRRYMTYVPCRLHRWLWPGIWVRRS